VIAGNLKRMLGREEEGTADIVEGIDQVMELGRMVDAHAFKMAGAIVSLLAGSFEEAEATLRPAHAALKAYGEIGYLSTLSGLLALSLASQGRNEEAELYVEEVRAIGVEDDAVTQSLWRAAKARILANRGDHDEARKLARESLELLVDRRYIDRIVHNLNAAEVDRAAGDTEAAKRLIEQAIDLREQKGIVIGEEWIQAQLAAV